MWAVGTFALLSTPARLFRVWAASGRMSDLPKSKRTPSSRVMTVPQDSTGLRDSTGGNLPSLPTFSTFGASLTVAVPSHLVGGDRHAGNGGEGRGSCLDDVLIRVRGEHVDRGNREEWDRGDLAGAVARDSRNRGGSCGLGGGSRGGLGGGRSRGSLGLRGAAGAQGGGVAATRAETVRVCHVMIMNLTVRENMRGAYCSGNHVKPRNFKEFRVILRVTQGVIRVRPGSLSALE